MCEVFEMINWYYAAGEERKGPFTEEEFLQLVKNGEIHDETLVWNEEMGNWEQYKSVKNSIDPTPPLPTPIEEHLEKIPYEALFSRTTNAELMTRARASLQGKWGLSIAVVFLCLIILSMASQLIPFAGFVLSGPMMLGLYIYFLALTRKGKIDISLLFKGFEHFLPAFITYLLISIFVFLWTLLFIIPGIIASYSYSMAFFVLADDPSISASSAIQISKMMMKGNKWKFFCLSWRFFGWSILCLLTFGIGIIWLYPYIYASVTHFYEDLKKGS